MKTFFKYWFVCLFFVAFFYAQKSLAFGNETIFFRNLREGMSGGDVLSLQKILNQDLETTVSPFGPGSLGNETTYFGAKTKEAVVRFQEKYREEILSPLGLYAGTGFVGQLSLKKLNQLSQNTQVLNTNVNVGSPQVNYFNNILRPEITLLDGFEMVEGKRFTITGKNFATDSKIIFSGDFGKATVSPETVSPDSIVFTFSTAYTKGIKDTLEELKDFDFSDDLFKSMQDALGGSGTRLEIPMFMAVEGGSTATTPVKVKIIFEK